MILLSHLSPTLLNLPELVRRNALHFRKEAILSSIGVFAGWFHSVKQRFTSELGDGAIVFSGGGRPYVVLRSLLSSQNIGKVIENVPPNDIILCVSGDASQ